MTSIPSLNVTPRASFGNWLWPSRRRQLFCAGLEQFEDHFALVNGGLDEGEQPVRVVAVANFV
jgi:hypothetical protein